VFHQGASPDGNGQPNGAGYIEFDNISFTDAGIPAVPEPGTLALVASGALGVLGAMKRRLFA
jgi:PEP-CTERM motif-containing protein